jgi:hypothetical protein
MCKNAYFTAYGRGAPGKFKVNQHAPVFAHRNTKRNKARNTRETKAVERSKDEE